MSGIPMLDLKREYLHRKAAIDAAITRCLDHQRWILGPEVGELEGEVASRFGHRHCVGVSSGTEALVLALRAIAIRRTGKEYFDRQDLVITTPFTFTATGDAILRAGATPLFVDIDPATFNLDPAKVHEAVAACAGRVVGILVVHLYGRSCEMAKFKEVADSEGLFLVEDVAQAFGGRWQSRYLGSLGEAGAFSFFPSKNLGCYGDGGMVATSDKELADLCRMLLKHGGRDKYNVDHIGYNARLDTIQAAVLLAKIGDLEEMNEKRREIASLYARELAGVVGIILPEEAEGHVFHQYTIRVPGGGRDALQKALAEEGIASMVYYPVPLHRMGVFRERMSVHGTLTEGERAAEEVLSLPIGPLMSEPEVRTVSGTLRRLLAR